MARDLRDFRIGDWVLTLDLLGTAVQMTEPQWLRSLNELLHTIDSSIKEVSRSGADDLHLVQYGDSITFVHDDVKALVSVGTSIQERLFCRDILAQFGLSGGGAYYLDDSTIHRVVDGLRNIKLHCLVGRGVARSHLILRGIKGPRFIIDEEIGHVPARGAFWQKTFSGLKSAGTLQYSDLRWWKDLPDVLEITDRRIERLQSTIESKNAERQEFAHVDSDIVRKIESLSKRLEHYKGFRELLEKNSG